jgi:hypothetical protein
LTAASSFTAGISGEGVSPSPFVSVIVGLKPISLVDGSAAGFARTGTLRKTRLASAHEKAYPDPRIVEHILPAARIQARHLDC